MKLDIEKYALKEFKNHTTQKGNVDLCWAIDCVSNKPVMFEVLNIDSQFGRDSQYLLPLVKSGAFAKISVDWVSGEYMNESFWVEITNINTNALGDTHFFGTCANNTERVGYGSVIGPIYPRNLIKVEE